MVSSEESSQQEWFCAFFTINKWLWVIGLFSRAFGRIFLVQQSRNLFLALIFLFAVQWMSVNERFLYLIIITFPGPRGFLWILSFLHANLRCKTLIEATSREKRKPPVKIVKNLTFMLAQHLTALKDSIFFWPITSPKIFNPSNHMTRRAIKNILQSETTVHCWWHESEDPNGLDQGLFSLRGSGSGHKIC